MFKKIPTRDVSDFIKENLVQYQMASTLRTIPHIADGLKPSQRKILYTLFKKNIKEEKKVNQLAGAVSDFSAYHHGEKSLESAIVGLAQDFISKNNINLLYPSGQFGTRYDSSKESVAQSRYIKTRLMEVSRYIFRPEDDEILNYLEDDGKKIEPEYYIPIIPMVLVNGAEGIGTGWSTQVNKYDPIKIIEALIRYLDGVNVQFERIPAYFRHFKGEISKTQDFIETKGIYEWKRKRIIISELPVGVWTQNFIDLLNKLIDEKKIKQYDNQSDADNVDFSILPSNELIDWNDEEILIKTLGLKSRVSTKNMNLFHNRVMKSYPSITDIFEDFIEIRLNGYERRKAFQMERLGKEMLKITNVVKFIKEIQNDTLVITKRKIKDLHAELETKKYDQIDNGYDYLTRMNIASLTYEKSKELEAEKKKKQNELKSLKEKTCEKLWQEELKELKQKLKD